MERNSGYKQGSNEQQYRRELEQLRSEGLLDERLEWKHSKQIPSEMTGKKLVNSRQSGINTSEINEF